MNTIKIVHTADLHLINPELINDRIRRKLSNDALLVFYDIINFCKEYKPDILFICGDFFSVHNTNISFAMKVFEKFSEIPFSQIVITPGNHDFLSSSSPYNTVKLPDNVHIFSEFSHFTLNGKNVNIYGAGFSGRFVDKSLLNAADDTDYINICAIHGDITNSVSEYNPISLENIKQSKYDYIALGHIHEYSGIKNLGITYYAYPGTPQGQGYDEMGEKGIIFGEISKDNISLNFKKMAKRMLIEHTFDISPYNQASEAFIAILKYLEKSNGKDFMNNLYRINIVGEYKENNTAYINYIKENLDNSLFYCEIIDGTKPDISTLRQQIDDSTLKGIYIKKLLNIIENSDEKTLRVAKKALYMGLEVLENDN